LYRIIIKQHNSVLHNMSYRRQPLILLPFILLLIGGFFFYKTVSAESAPENFCPGFVKNIDALCLEMGVQKCKDRLKECEEYYHRQSDKYQSEISRIAQKKRSLENEINKLNKEIKSLNYKIYKNSLIIKDLNLQINDTNESIRKTNIKIKEIKERISSLLRLRYEADKRSVLEIFLRRENLSDFFSDIMALELLNRETQKLLVDIKALKESLEKQNESMLSEKERLEQTQILVKLQRSKSENIKKNKDNLLKATKGKEALYQKYLSETEKKAQKIRKKIFELVQVAGGEKLTLEQAYKLALEVESITGIRPAFLLGLLKVESDIGNNVGQCNCGEASFCRHPEISWQKVMKKRQWPYFLQITRELGLNPTVTPVSCSVNGGKVQWGGAMGPAQFMPETWIKLGYKKRVEDITGIRPANPWKVKDAFLAAALYLKDWGADSQRELKEIGAARAYLCGTSRLTRTCRIAGGRTYAYNVMKYANKFQDYIDKGILK